MELINVIEEGSCLNSKLDEATYMAKIKEKLPSIANQPSTYIEPMMEDLDEISFDHSNLDRKVLIGSRLEADRRNKLITFLAEHMDCFTWSYEDMISIHTSIITHQLRVASDHPSIK